DLENDDVGLARGDALQGGHLLATGRAPRRPKVHDNDLAAVCGESEGLAVEARPLEVRGRRSDPAGRAVRLDLRADDARVGHGRGLVQELPEERGEKGQRELREDGRSDPTLGRERTAIE